MPEKLWKLSVTYVFEDTDFPIGGLKPRFCKFILVCCISDLAGEEELADARIVEEDQRNEEQVEEDTPKEEQEEEEDVDENLPEDLPEIPEEEEEIDLEKLREKSCLKQIYPAVYEGEYEQLRVMERVAELYIHGQGVRKNNGISGSAFRNLMKWVNHGEGSWAIHSWTGVRKNSGISWSVIRNLMRRVDSGWRSCIYTARGAGKLRNIWVGVTELNKVGRSLMERVAELLIHGQGWRKNPGYLCQRSVTWLGW